MTASSPLPNARRGVSWEEVFEGYCDRAQAARERHRVEVRLTPNVARGLPLEDAVLTARHAVAYRERGVVGRRWAVTSPGTRPRSTSPHSRWRATAGLASVPHADEGAGPASIRGALGALRADRLRHGIRAVEDPGLVRDLAGRGVVLDACLVPNLRTGAVRSLAAHPLPALVAAGVRCSLSTDDPAMFGTDLAREYAAAAALGVPARVLFDAGVDGALRDASTRERLRAIGASFPWPGDAPQAAATRRTGGLLIGVPTPGPVPGPGWAPGHGARAGAGGQGKDHRQPRRGRRAGPRGTSLRHSSGPTAGNRSSDCARTQRREVACTAAPAAQRRSSGAHTGRIRNGGRYVWTRSGCGRGRRAVTATRSPAPHRSGREHAFDAERLRGVYDAIAGRRNVRSFRPDPVPDDVLWRLLGAAHRAPSVGLMQPWDFLVVRDVEARRRVQALFAREKAAAAAFFDDPRRDHYLQLKLEGILDAPLNVLVTCDPTRAGPEVLGRHGIPETDVYSTCLAVENFWLAARAESIGVGWVSILRNPELREIFGIPPHVIPVAYLCVGFTDEFPDAPLLESAGWASRESLAGLVHHDRWGRKTAPGGFRTMMNVRSATSPTPASLLARTVGRVAPLDAAAGAEARSRQDRLTKPPGSLGRLERLAIQVAGITGTARPRLERKAVVVMAGDHGVTAEGVSAYPAAVTPQMVANFARGGAAINVLARRAGARVVVVDVGVAADLPPDLSVLHRKVARGTANFAQGPAMAQEQALAAVAVGLDVVERESQQGLDVVCLGEMGIGNTTAAAAIVAAVTGRRVADVTGRGTGIDDETWRRKVAVIERGLRVNRPDPGDPLDVLAKVGGLEIAGLVGVSLGAAARRVPIIVDGFIATAAAVLAGELCPAARAYMIAAHRSVEVGHRAALEHLELEPLLALDLRLGEGTGAALALPIVESALALLDEMATFEEASVSGALAAGTGSAQADEGVPSPVQERTPR